MQAKKSVVHIKAEAGGVYGGKRQAARTPDGRIVILNNVKPIYYKRHGAGIIIKDTGIIVTNAHIVKQASRITVTLHDDTKIEASLEKMIPEQDIAFLKIKPPYPLQPLALVA